MSINKIIEEQREEFEKFFVKIIPNDSKDLEASKLLQKIYDATYQKQKEQFYNWHINAMKQFVDTLIEEKKGKKLENQINEEFRSGYNVCLDEDITNLTNIKNNIK